MTTKSFLFEMLETFLTSLIVLFVLYMWIAMPEVVWGASMEPGFHTGERILVEKVSKYFVGFKRGDVVVLTPPVSEKADYIKRIIGIPGDIVKIYECEIQINRDGEKFILEEPYLYPGMCTSAGPRISEGKSFKIPDNSYMVLGDNREVSADSRYFGLVDKKDIQGKAIFRFWPVSKLGFL